MPETTKLIQVDAPGARPKFEAWLARGDAIGVFENHDIGHYRAGEVVFMPIYAAEMDKAKVGETKAPDGFYGLGWRYILTAMERDISRFEFIEGRTT